MEEEHKSRLSSIITTVVVIVLVVILGVWLALRNHASWTKNPGKIVYDASLTEAERDFLTNISSLEGAELGEDVTISSISKTVAESDEDEILYSILLPVTDLSDKRLGITTEQLDRLIATGTLCNSSASPTSTETSNISSCSEPNVRLLSVADLNPEVKLLSVDNNYYLDTFTSGAEFRYFTFSSESVDEKNRVIDLIRPEVAKFPSSDTVLSFAQTGVTAPSRGMFTKLQQVGDASYFAEKIGPYLSKFDLTHTSNESSFSAQANSNNICAAPGMIDALTAIGLDIVELTGNHNIDCGDEDAIKTIDKYNELGIKTIGGGVSAETAATPLQINQKDTSITMLAYNLSTGGYTLDNTPGANFYTEEKAVADIKAAKERGDFIIIDVQYYECNEYAYTTENTTCDRANSSAGDQVGFFRHLVDLGADIVVGTSAHQPQTFEQYKDGYIYYGLGNLFFDQSWWPGTTRSIVLAHYFINGKLVQTRLVPTVFDSNYQPRLMSVTDAENFLTRLRSVAP